MTTPSEPDRRARATPVLDADPQSPPDLPPPITADDVTPTPPDRAKPSAAESTDVSLTFERS